MCVQIRMHSSFCQCLGNVGATISNAGQSGDHSPNVWLLAGQHIGMHDEERHDGGGTLGHCTLDHQILWALVVNPPVALLYFQAIHWKLCAQLHISCAGDVEFDKNSSHKMCFECEHKKLITDIENFNRFVNVCSSCRLHNDPGCAGHP